MTYDQRLLRKWIAACSIATLTSLLCLVCIGWAAEPAKLLQVSQSGTFLETTDKKPFFVLADTCWTGPALSSKEDWDLYLNDRKAKGFTAIQFNMVSPWRTAPTDLEGRTSYIRDASGFKINESFYSERLDARMQAIVDAGLIPVPVLCWAHKAGDAGMELAETEIVQLVRYELDRYQNLPAFWILAGDNGYRKDEADKWKRIGREVFRDRDSLLTTTHPTGMNWPWDDWMEETWLDVFSYQSGHSDSADFANWIHHGPPFQYSKNMSTAEKSKSNVRYRPVMNLEPPYEAHFSYASGKALDDYVIRRAMYWSLLSTPMAGITYGGHGVWSWHTKPGEPPTDHPKTGIAPVWREALDLPGAKQMSYLKKLIDSIPWTELRPARELLQQDGKDPLKFAVVAATPNKQNAVAYLPRGAKATWNEGFEKGKSFRCMNPATGEWSEGGSPLPNSSSDWVVVAEVKQ